MALTLCVYLGAAAQRRSLWLHFGLLQLSLSRVSADSGACVCLMLNDLCVGKLTWWVHQFLSRLSSLGPVAEWLRRQIKVLVTQVARVRTPSGSITIKTTNLRRYSAAVSTQDSDSWNLSSNLGSAFLFHLQSEKQWTVLFSLFISWLRTQTQKHCSFDKNERKQKAGFRNCGRQDGRNQEWKVWAIWESNPGQPDHNRTH